MLLIRLLRVFSRRRNFQELAAAADRLHLLPRTHYQSVKESTMVRYSMGAHAGIIIRSFL